MKKLIATMIVLLSPLCGADEGATKAAKAHLDSFLKGKHGELARTYAPKVALIPGHEFLKAEYGLAGDGTRAEGAEVGRDKLIAAMEKAAAGRPDRPAGRVDALLETMKYEVIEVAEGKVGIDPSDPVGTPDGKLHFEIKKGDVLLKVSPPKGDFLVFHLRRIDGSWRIVAEYLD